MRLVQEDGQLARAIDEVYPRAVAEQRHRLERVLVYGLATTLSIFLVLPALHVALTPAIVVPLVVLAHFIVVRTYLLKRAHRLLSGPRRTFLRWLTRLGFFWAGSFGYGLTAVPVLGVISGVATFSALTLASHHYALWSLGRERRRERLAGWEKATLVAFILLTLLLIAFLIGLGLLIGWSITVIRDLFA